MSASMSLTTVSCLPISRDVAVGLLVGQPLRLAGQAGRLGLGREVQPAGPDPLRDHAPGFQPAQLERRILGAGDEIAPDEGQFGGVGGGDAQQPQHRRGEVESVQIDRRHGAVPFGQPHRGHPETDVARDAHAARLPAQARVGGADLVVGGQLQVRLLGGDLGEHRVDRLGRDRHQRRLHPLEQRRLVLVGADDQRDWMGAALSGKLHRIVGHQVAVDERGECQRAGAASRGRRRTRRWRR